MRWMTALVIGLSVLSVAGCPLGREATVAQLRADNPRVQCDTIAQVARDNDKTMVPELIDLMDSPDEGVRFVADAGLHRLTGKSFGRPCEKDPEKRAASVKQWRQWWETEGRAASGVPAPKNEVKTPASTKQTTSTGPSKERGS